VTSRPRTPLRIVRLVLCSAALMIAARAAGEDRQLRVCADPNNLPFSNSRLEGFENKVAQLIADEMHATVRYTWHPQRRGFIRDTLTARACDLVVGVPTGYELVLSTKPYYRSTYVFVSPTRRNLQLRSFDDPVLRGLKIGVEELGSDGGNTPPAHALARRGLAGNIVGFKLWDVESVESPPGKIIDAVSSGAIDVAIVWGPFGGYFAKQHPAGSLKVVPVSPASSDPASIPFAYDMSMGVRPGETAFKTELEVILDRRRGEIERILEQYGVPLVNRALHSGKEPEEQ
jgi:quinoprotein dehydrogenase-associated probable ABC transporter substrate-binding protein